MDFVVRSNVDRNIGTRKEPLRLSKKLAEVAAYEETFTIEVPVIQIGGGKSLVQKKRHAILQLKSTSATFEPSRKLTQVVKEFANIKVVEIKEIAVPENCEPLHWTLFTSLEVNNFEEAKNIAAFMQ